MFRAVSGNSLGLDRLLLDAIFYVKGLQNQRWSTEQVLKVVFRVQFWIFWHIFQQKNILTAGVNENKRLKDSFFFDKGNWEKLKLFRQKFIVWVAGWYWFVGLQIVSVKLCNFRGLKISVNSKLILYLRLFKSWFFSDLLRWILRLRFFVSFRW